MSEVQESYYEIKKLLQHYDKSLGRVLKQSEQDFINAYQQHMMKIEKELQNLKNKAKDQDTKIN
jgi:hypothetical protein